MAIKQLGAEHYQAIALLAKPKKGGLTYDQIAQECGVHVNTIYAWRKDPLFEREFKREVIRGTQDKLSEMMDALIDAAIKDGNAAAAKLILTANDMLTDKVEVTTESKGGKDIDEIKARLAKYRADSTAE